MKSLPMLSCLIFICIVLENGKAFYVKPFLTLSGQSSLSRIHVLPQQRILDLSIVSSPSASTSNDTELSGSNNRRKKGDTERTMRVDRAVNLRTFVYRYLYTPPSTSLTSPISPSNNDNRSNNDDNNHGDDQKGKAECTSKQGSKAVVDLYGMLHVATPSYYSQIGELFVCTAVLPLP